MSFAVNGLFVLGLIYTLYFAQAIVKPVLLALLFSMVLWAPVRLLKRLGVPPGLGAVLVLAATVAAAVSAVSQLAAPAEAWFGRTPMIMAQIEAKLGELRGTLEAARDVTRRLSELTDVGGGDGEAAAVVAQGPSLAAQIFENVQAMLVSLALMVSLIYFLLAFGQQMVRRILLAIPRAEESGRLAGVLDRIGRDIAYYLQTVTAINIVLGIVTGLAMAALGMPEPALWGVLAGLLNFIPYIGPAVTLMIIGIVSLLTFNQWADILWPPLIFLCFNIIEGQFATPTIVGRRLTLNPILVFLAIMFWGWMWGVVGAFLAVPILVVASVVVKQSGILRPMQAPVAESVARPMQVPVPAAQPQQPAPPPAAAQGAVPAAVEPVHGQSP